MVNYNGVTYLFYSANDSAWQDTYGRSNYATGYAICPHGPLRACTASERRPDAAARDAAGSARVPAGPHP